MKSSQKGVSIENDQSANLTNQYWEHTLESITEYISNLDRFTPDIKALLILDKIRMLIVAGRSILSYGVDIEISELESHEDSAESNRAGLYNRRERIHRMVDVVEGQFRELEQYILDLRSSHGVIYSGLVEEAKRGNAPSSYPHRVPPPGSGTTNYRRASPTNYETKSGLSSTRRQPETKSAIFDRERRSQPNIAPSNPAPHMKVHPRSVNSSMVEPHPQIQFQPRTQIQSHPRSPDLRSPIQGSASNRSAAHSAPSSPLYSPNIRNHNIAPINTQPTSQPKEKTSPTEDLSSLSPIERLRAKRAAKKKSG